MNVILFDAPALRTHLLPFTFLRPLAATRVGILTIEEKIRKYFESQSESVNVSFLTQDYLKAKYPLHLEKGSFYINGALLPDQKTIEAISQLSLEESLLMEDELIALRTSNPFDDIEELYEYALKTKSQQIEANCLHRTWDIFLKNREELHKDFELITAGRQSRTISDPHTVVYGKENVFVEEGADIKAAILNADKGKIYIGKEAIVEEGSIIRGAFALGEGAVVNTGAKIRGDSSIGKYCKVGGELSNVVFQAYSNKGHDGFLGNAVIGEWCNLGADTNCSNLKNNYGLVRVWDYAEENYETTDLQFCGLLMGDHSKTGINTMFNTGTVVGVGTNVFGEGFPAKFVPSFGWGGKDKLETTHIDALYKSAERMMARRNVEFTEVDKAILRHVYEETENFRYWESNPLF